MWVASDLFSLVPEEVNVEDFHRVGKEVRKQTYDNSRLFVMMNEYKVSSNEK